MMGAEEVLAQHLKAIFMDLNVLVLQMFAKETPHHLTTLAASLGIVVIERFGMRCLQQVVELGPVRIGKTDEAARRIHSGNAGEIGISALLAEMLPFRPLFWVETLAAERGEMNRGLSLVTCLAKHKTIYNPTNQPCRCQFSLSTLSGSPGTS